MKTIFAIFFCVLILNSCEYQLNSENYRRLQSLDSTYKISVDILPTEFPENLEEPVMVKYNFHQTDLILYVVRVYIDTYLTFESTELQDSFLIHPYSYSEGDHIVVMQFITNSKSESLADITGYEAVLFQAQWSFYNRDWLYPGIGISSLVNDNGIMKITWDTTTLEGFKKYKLYRKWEYCEPKMIGEFDDFYKTEYYDWEYYGGNVNYWVEVETDTLSTASREVFAFYLYPRFDVLWVRDGDVMIYWNKSPFHKVVKGYELSVAIDDTTNAVLFTTDNPSDTTYLLDGIPANKVVKYTLRIKIEGPDPGQTLWSDLISYGQLTYKPRVIP